VERLCGTNFYLSFLRYPLHLLRGLPSEQYEWVSGIPLFGSLLVGSSLLGLHAMPYVLPAALAIILIDTGGVHWFLGGLLYEMLRKRGDGS
jgi:hypothetical protein